MHTNAPKLELHILQNFPPHNLNRDDTGAPKDTEFGGYRRGRISSQCLKRSIRWSPSFGAELGGRIAIRTKRSAERLAEILTTAHAQDAKAAERVARAAIGKLVTAVDGDGKTNVLFYVGPDELEAVAARLNDVWGTLAPALAAEPTQEEPTDTAKPDEKAKGKGKAKKEKQADTGLDDAVSPVIEGYLKEYDGTVGTADVALFGRMLAEKPTLNIDAACHVAHAISTNRVSMDFDYFTAVDDLNPGGETGAGMIGTAMFNSSCFYRYAVIDLGQLYGNLGDDQREGTREHALAAVRAFIRGAVEAIPSGKQASTAAYTPPGFVMAVVRPNGGQPMSLANAFEKPVAPRHDSGLVAESVGRLDTHWRELTRMYGERGARPIVAAMDSVAGTLETLAPYRCAGIDELLERSIETLGSEWTTGGAA